MTLTPAFLPMSRTVQCVLRMFLDIREASFVVSGRMVACRRKQQNVRALECLAHAIEYLEDTMPIVAEKTAPLLSREEAVTLLKSRSRDLFFSCPGRRDFNAAADWTVTLRAGYDNHTQWAGC